MVFMEALTYKILLVDDEPDILEFMGYNLRKEGYLVTTCTNGKDALKLAQQHIPHLIVLDVMMPEMDGIETCSELRKIPEIQNTIITFLSARSEDFTHIAGLDAGADDYITKPIKPQILISKIKSLLRRPAFNTANEQEKILQIGDISINRETYTISLHNKPLIMPRKEFELLSLLASKPNKVFSREEIFSRVWDNDVIVGDRTIDVHIRKIREKIGDYIKTVKGVGYKFEL